MRRSSVSLPVATTMPVARPDTTMVPENAMLPRSPTVRVDGDGVRCLLRRHQLAGQCGLFRVKILHVGEEEAAPCRPIRAVLRPRVPTGPGNHPRRAAAHGPRFRGKHVADRIQGFLRPALLNEAEERI